MATNYERLTVYQLACDLARVVWGSTRTWDGFARDTVGKQLVRSVDSVAANIAEGSGRGSAVDFRRHLYIARGSLYESAHWLRTAQDRSLLRPDEHATATDLMRQLLPMLNALIRSITASSRVADPAAPYTPGEAPMVDPNDELDPRQTTND